MTARRPISLTWRIVITNVVAIIGGLTLGYGLAAIARAIW